MDLIYLVNLVLCIIIVIMGYWGFKKRGDLVPLYIGTAFGLFGVSHLMMLIGLGATYESALIVIRILAYLIVIFAMYKVVKR